MIKFAVLVVAVLVSSGAAYAGCPGGVCHLKNRATIVDATIVKNIETNPVVVTADSNTVKVVSNCCSSVSTKCCTKNRRCRRCCR